MFAYNEGYRVNRGGLRGIESPTILKGEVMKKLEECRAYFEDVYMDMLDNYVFSEGSKRLKTFEETLTFIYGDEYKRIAPRWKQEALSKYYSAKYEGVTV